MLSNFSLARSLSLSHSASVSLALCIHACIACRLDMPTDQITIFVDGCTGCSVVLFSAWVIS